MDQSNGLAAVIQSKIVANIFFRAMYRGAFPKWQEKIFIGKNKSDPYTTALLNMFIRPSLKNG